jgi:hypothetical protein
MEPTDHDLLIKLNTTVELLHAQQLKIMTDHIADDAHQFSETKGKIDAVHKRMDGFVGTVNEKVNKMISMKDKIVGGAIVIGALYSFAFGLISLTKH